MTEQSSTPVSLISFTVEYRPAGSTESHYFQTMARNKSEAMRNARQANPACTVVSATDSNLQTHVPPECDDPWRPSVQPDTYPSLEEIVGQVVGTGSICWKEPPAGVFDDEKARWATEGAVAAIRKLYAFEDHMDATTLPNEIRRKWEGCSRAEAIRQCEANHESLLNAHKTIDALRAKLGYAESPSGPEPGIAQDPWQGARDDDKLHLIRVLLDGTTAFGSDMADFKRRLELIVNA